MSGAAGATRSAGVRAETLDGVLTLTLEHPGKRNALTWAMYDQLDEHLAAAAGDPTLLAVVLVGGGDEQELPPLAALPCPSK